MIREVERKTLPGLVVLVLLLALTAVDIYLLVTAIQAESVAGIITTIVALLVILVAWGGLFVVNPNEAKVLQLFGKLSAARFASPGCGTPTPFTPKSRSRHGCDPRERGRAARGRDGQSRETARLEGRGRPRRRPAAEARRVVPRGGGRLQALDLQRVA